VIPVAYDGTKVLATRNSKVYTVAWDATNTIPLDTTAYGTAWGTPAGQTNPYVESGLVTGGLHFTTSVQRGAINVDQLIDPVLRPATGRSANMSTTLAEFGAANIKNATGQGAITTVAATTANRGHDDWDMDSTIADLFLTIGFDLQAQDGEAVRVIGWKGQTEGSPTFDFGPTSAAGIPLNLVLLPDTSTSPARVAKIRDVIPHS
jgi:hypothetical protein